MNSTPITRLKKFHRRHGWFRFASAAAILALIVAIDISVDVVLQNVFVYPVPQLYTGDWVVYSFRVDIIDHAGFWLAVLALALILANVYYKNKLTARRGGAIVLALTAVFCYVSSSSYLSSLQRGSPTQYTSSHCMAEGKYIFGHSSVNDKTDFPCTAQRQAYGWPVTSAVAYSNVQETDGMPAPVARYVEDGDFSIGSSRWQQRYPSSVITGNDLALFASGALLAFLIVRFTPRWSRVKRTVIISTLEIVYLLGLCLAGILFAT